MSNPFEPNTTYWKKATLFDGGCYGQESTRNYLYVCKTTPHTITTSDGKRHRVCCDEYGKYVKIGYTTFYADDVKKEYPNKNKEPIVSDETLKRFAKQFKKRRAKGAILSHDNVYDYLNWYIFQRWRGSIDEDMTLEEYIEKKFLSL